MVSGKATEAAVKPVDALPTSPVTKPTGDDDTQPPPEKPSEQRRRTYIILSFWALVLLLGLPIWWKTTSIYRAELPLTDMLSWADGKVRYNRPPSRTCNSCLSFLHILSFLSLTGSVIE